MKSSRTRPLIALNLVLLGLVVAFGLARHAGAEDAAQPTRARGVYTMVSGSIQGGSNDVVYVMDTANQEMIALGWDNAKGVLGVIGYRSLVADTQNSRGNR
jgi:hypothetical protein